MTMRLQNWYLRTAEVGHRVAPTKGLKATPIHQPSRNPSIEHICVDCIVFGIGIEYLTCFQHKATHVARN
jgi:hypothetical protein